MTESLPNTDGYELLTLEELIELSEVEQSTEHTPYTLVRGIHEPDLIPAVLLDFNDGRKAYYTMKTAIEVIKLLES